MPPTDPLPQSNDQPPREPTAEQLAALQLQLVPGIGPRLQRQLLDRFGSPAAVFAAKRSELEDVSGIGPRLATAIIAHAAPGAAAREWENCRQQGIELVSGEHSLYPTGFSRLDDPPLTLWVRGPLLPRDQLAIAIVGSRQCTHYGRTVARKLAAGLAAAGVTVVSGLARGIDGQAHEGALEAGGRTIAVLGSGLGVIYPPEHADLAERIAASGAIVSEHPCGQAPLPGLFPQRNRLISGLSLGVVLVEAGRKSGALHTARHAIEQGVDVFAVPGRIDSDASAGCHDLLRDGARLVTCVDDILNEVSHPLKPIALNSSGKLPSAIEVRHARELLLNEQEAAVLQQVTAEPVQLDDVIRASGLEPARVMTTITVLEMKRLITRLPGGFLARSG